MAVLIGPWLVGSITISAPGVNASGLLDQRPDEEQQLLQRHELAERHQMHLLIHAGDRAVLAHEKRRVVVRLRLVIHLIAAEQQLDARLAHERANPLAADRVVQERKRRGRFGPDDELRPLAGGLARHGQIRVQDGFGVRVIPLLILGNVSLNQRDAHRTSLLDQHVVLEPSVAPDDDPANKRGGSDADGDDATRASGRRRNTRAPC